MLCTSLSRIIFFLFLFTAFSFGGENDCQQSIQQQEIIQQEIIQQEIVQQPIQQQKIVLQTVEQQVIYQQNLKNELLSQQQLNFHDLSVEIINLENAFSLISQLDLDWPSIFLKLFAGTSVIVVTGTVSLVASASGIEPVAFVAAAAFEGAVKEAAYGVAIGGALGAFIGNIAGNGDEKVVMKHFIEGAVDGYMWGALIGAVTGGIGGYKELALAKGASAAIEVFSKPVSNAERAASQMPSKTEALSKAASGVEEAAIQTGKVLTKTEQLAISQSTKWPMRVVERIITKEQYEILEQAGLEFMEVNGRPSLCKKIIDLDFVAEKTKTAKFPKGRTNRELMKDGKAPYDPATGEKIELHHLNQEFDGPFVELTNIEHGTSPNHGILHPKKTESWRRQAGKPEEYSKQRRDHWLERGAKF